jgi:hypothetical protein
MAAYRHEVRRLEEKFNNFELHHILRWDNEKVDTLARLGSSREPTPPGVFTQDLFKPSIRLEEDIPPLTSRTSPGEGSLVPMPRTPSGKGGTTRSYEADPGTPVGPVSKDREPGGRVVAIVGPLGLDANWWKPIFEYLWWGTIPDGEIETQRLARQAKGYLIHNDELYRRSISGVLQQCIPAEEGKMLLLDIHEWICRHHASSRSMVRKAFWQGFYWSTVTSYAAQIVRSCRVCQYFTSQTNGPAKEL